jgi:5-methylcytosine-specific restriction endonuclease McrA
MGWYEERFEARPNRVECSCLHCGRKYWLPPSKATERTTCGKDCRKSFNDATKASRERDCLHCGAQFTPRKAQIDAGEGRYCSLRCSTVCNGQLWTPSARAIATEKFLANIKSGEYVLPRGEKHCQWAGGKEAHLERMKASGKRAEWTRNYRKRNPEKVREFCARRKGRKLGRLPRGTVKRIGELQRWKCGCCRVNIRDKYHVDHIVSLKAGGAHAPTNLQLLCPTCNVKKSAKDPIDFMRERGFLL